MAIIKNGYHGGLMVLVSQLTNKPAEIGDILISDGERYQLLGGTAPHKSSSTGRIYVENLSNGMKAEYFPSVLDLEWQDAPLRPN